MASSPAKVPVYALLPAAGRGSRMGGERKQFRQLGDAPVLVQTMRAFDLHDDVSGLVVAAPSDEQERCERIVSGFEFSCQVDVVAGGASRQASVRAMLSAVGEDEAIVLVHDAVRPFIRQAHISRVIEAVRSAGAASLAVPVRDTLRRSDEDVFGETVSREDIHQMQTPQGFVKHELLEAHERQEDAQVTDDVELVQRAGRSVAYVKGSTQNIKLTTPADWELAEAFWPVWKNRKVAL